MSRIKLFIPLFIFALLAALFYPVMKQLQRGEYDPQSLPSALVGQPMPAFSLPLLRGNKTMTHQELLGEVYLLNVWATWCMTCRIEHPHLNDLAAKGVKIVGMDYKDERDKAIAWLEKLGNPYAFVLFDADGKLGLDLGVYGAPETYLIDKQGVIRYKHVGMVDAKVWQEQFKPLYDELNKS